jgi:hypothetical protein
MVTGSSSGRAAISKSALNPYLPRVDIFIIHLSEYYGKKITMFTKLVKIIVRKIQCWGVWLAAGLRLAFASTFPVIFREESVGKQHSRKPGDQ